MLSWESQERGFIKMLNGKWQFKNVFIIFSMLLFSACASAEALFNCSFAKGKLDPIPLRSRRTK